MGMVNATPWPFYSRKWTGTYCIGSWVGSRAVLQVWRNVNCNFCIGGGKLLLALLLLLMMMIIIIIKTVIIGATGIVTRSLRKNLETVPGKHSIDSLQKTVILGTSHIIRKVLQCKAWSVSGWDHGWFKRSTRQERHVTRDIHIV